jgi:hypothetical protein
MEVNKKKVTRKRIAKIEKLEIDKKKKLRYNYIMKNF